jgi:hypothetical protein
VSRDFFGGLIAGLLLAGLLLWSAASLAQVSVTVYGLSRHSESGYCEINPGLSINYQVTEDLRIGAGRFLNSKCRWSNGLGPVYTPLRVGSFRFGAGLIRLTGYKESAVWAPLPMGSYAIDRRHAIDFFVAHKGEESVGGAAWRISF